MAENVIEDIEERVEDLFPHKPGGMVDRHRKERAKREAEAAEREHVSEKIEQSSYKAVKVAQQSPEKFVPVTYTIAPGGTGPVLPLNPYRYRASIMLVTVGATVVLCADNGGAIANPPVGFTLPYGIPFPVFGRGQLIGFNNTASTIQVSVLSENYAPEK